MVGENKDINEYEILIPERLRLKWQWHLRVEKPSFVHLVQLTS